MAKRQRRSFTAEYKSEAVRLVREGGMTVAQVVRDLDLTESALRNWVQQAEVDAGKVTFPRFCGHPRKARECTTEVSMTRRKQRRFTKEQKAEAVRLVQTSGKSVYRVAQELDLTETALRRWVQQAEIDAGQGPADAMTTEELSELRRLRRENRRLRMERDFLKQAALGSTGQCNSLI